MEKSDIINFRAVSKTLGYCPTHIRKKRLPKSEIDKQAVEELINFTDNWAEKYTKTK